MLVGNKSIQISYKPDIERTGKKTSVLKLTQTHIIRRIWKSLL